MAHRTRKRRLLGAIGVTALATGTVLATTTLPAAHAETTAQAAAAGVTVRPDPSYSGEKFEGWGTSLVWFANATGDYPPAVREKLYKLLFGDDGLALNIARYNIGGGNAPDVKDYLRAGGGRRGLVEGAGGHDPRGRRLVGRRRTRPTGTRTPTRRSAGGSTASRRTSPTGRPSATPRPGS